MTRYTVVWHQEALDELARLWIDAPDRTAVTLAAGHVKCSDGSGQRAYSARSKSILTLVATSIRPRPNGVVFSAAFTRCGGWFPDA